MRPFLARLPEHMAELTEELRTAEQERDAYIERKRIAREEKERLEAERRLAEEAEEEANE